MNIPENQLVLKAANAARRGAIRAISVGLALAVVLTLGAGGAAAQKQKKSKSQKDAGADPIFSLPDPQAIDITVSRMLAAWQVGDVQEMHKYYADDVVMVSGTWEPPIIGWDNYVQAYRAQWSRTQAPRMDRTNTFTKVMGDTAWSTYQWRFVGQVDGALADAVGHTTLVMQKRGGNWIIVMNHTSSSPTPGAPVSAVPDARPNTAAASRP